MKEPKRVTGAQLKAALRKQRQRADPPIGPPEAEEIPDGLSLTVSCVRCRRQSPQWSWSMAALIHMKLSSAQKRQMHIDSGWRQVGRDWCCPSCSTEADS